MAFLSLSRMLYALWQHDISQGKQYILARKAVMMMMTDDAFWHEWYVDGTWHI